MIPSSLHSSEPDVSRAQVLRHGRLDRAKGEVHHALKNALRIGRQGKIRDRTTESQHFRIAGLNLLAVIVIYWNTLPLGHAVAQRQSDGLSVPPELRTHISTLGWAHILLTANIDGRERWWTRLRVSFSTQP